MSDVSKLDPDRLSARDGAAMQLYRDALALHRAGKLAEAIVGYDKAIAVDNAQPDFHNNRGVALAQSGALAAAEASYARALAIDPDHADTHVNCGIMLGNSGRFAEAVARFDRALAIRPNHHAALANRAAALNQLRPQASGQQGQVDAAIAEGLSLGLAGRHAESLRAFDRALTIDPASALALANRGTALMALDRPEAALDAFDAALSGGLNELSLQRNRAAVAYRLGQFDDAIRSYDAALMLDSGNIELLRARANALLKAGRTVHALEGLEAMLAVAPDDLLALNQAGAVEKMLGSDTRALKKFDRAIAAHPDDPLGHSNRAGILQSQRRYDESRQSLLRTLALDPAFPMGKGRLLHLNISLADWADFDRLHAEVIDEVRRGEEAATPHALLALTDDPALHRIAAGTYMARFTPADRVALSARTDGRIRLGYFSADFHDHATMYLMADLIEAHDRARFDVFGYSFGGGAGQAMHGRAVDAFDHFIDVRALTDADIAARARTDGIDIAIDLKGITANSRPAIFAERAAPIQVNYLGYPGTMAAPFFDYLVGDKVVIGADARSAIAERVIYLPDCYQPNCRLAAIDATPDRTALGLPADGFLFGCFNQIYKILPDVFARWMAILQAVDGSVLWLWSGDPLVSANLRREAEDRGIDGARLRFAETVGRSAHLARLRLVDLFLDTMPYNAHTTASDALRVGVPVLTCMGQSFASRVAASLLTSLDLGTLITSTLDEYEAMAIALARDADRLGALRAALANNIQTSSLFDSANYARKLEEAFVAIHNRFRQGGQPEDVWIS